jgi:hypothetical protein
LRDRKAAWGLHQRQKEIARRIHGVLAVEIFNALTGAELIEITEALLPEYRERLYPPTVTLSMYVKQVLEEDGSCQRAVNHWAAQRVAEGLSAVSASTGAYCKARQRLPLEMVKALVEQTGRVLSERAEGTWNWRGRKVKLVDGTSVSMLDTPENQTEFPQSSSQAEGLGFPLARLVAVLCLSTGAVLGAQIGPFKGKGTGEVDLFRSLLEKFSAGEVMLADALFCNYFLIATLQQADVDVLFEQHGARITDFRRGQRLGERDHVVHWPKPQRPKWMTPEQYGRFPDQITVRESKVHGRVLVTTMLDAREIPKGELGELYQRRWNVELDLRNIKTTLGMDVLNCRTPEMNRKQLWVHLLAYNLIRLLMVEAARSAAIHPRQLSFKHTVQILTAWLSKGLFDQTDQGKSAILRLIAQRKVGNRPKRIEPRARKRRPKPFPLLNTTRSQARERIRASWSSAAA